MAANDVWQGNLVHDVSGQSASVILHFEEIAGSAGLTDYQIAQNLSAAINAQLPTWAAAASVAATIVGVILQRIHPTRGVQFGFTLNVDGLVAGECSPANLAVQINRYGPGTPTGHNFWPGVAEAHTRSGRLTGAGRTLWNAWSVLLDSDDWTESPMTWRPRVWSRVQQLPFAVTKVETRAVLKKIRNRTPKALI